MRKPEGNDADFGEEAASPGETQGQQSVTRNVTEPNIKGVGATAQTTTSFNKSQVGLVDSQSDFSLGNAYALKSKKTQQQQQEPLPWIKKLPYIKSPMKRKPT